MTGARGMFGPGSARQRPASSSPWPRGATSATAGPGEAPGPDRSGRGGRRRGLVGDRFGPHPYAQPWLLDLTVPFLTNRRLDPLLGVRPGQRVLEVGLGIGLRALHVAGVLGAGGRPDIVDIQQPMPDHVMRRAVAGTICPIVVARADARDLPFEDGSSSPVPVPKWLPAAEDA